MSVDNLSFEFYPTNKQITLSWSYDKVDGVSITVDSVACDI